MRIKLLNTDNLSNHSLKMFLLILFSWTLSISRPVLQLLGEQPTFLIAHDVNGWVLIFSSLAFCFLVPVIIWVVLLFVGLFSNKLKEWTLWVVLVVFFIVLFLQAVQSLPTEMALGLAFILSLVVLFLLMRFAVVKVFAYWYSMASVIFLSYFLFLSPTKQLLPNFSAKALNVKSVKKNPIYVIVLDELPLLSLLQERYKIDSDRFPEFSKFANQSTWYPNAHTISSATMIALPTILSGDLPTKGKLKSGVFREFPNNLFTFFSNSHSIHAVENTTRICPPNLCKPTFNDNLSLLFEDTLISFLYKVFPKEQLTNLPPINDRWIGFMRELKKDDGDLSGDFSHRLDKFNTFISKFDQYPENTVHFLHVLLPHAPWRVLPNLDLYGFYEKEGIPGELIKAIDKSKYSHQWTSDTWAVNLAWRRHLLQVGAMDKMLGKTINKIKDIGQYDKATIVVVADHGSAFIPTLSRRFAHKNNIPSISSIPLFIKYPNQIKGIVDKRPANNLDILATLLDIFEIKVNQIDGISLKSNIPRENRLPIYQEDGIVTNIPENYELVLRQRLIAKNKLFNKRGFKGVYHPVDTESFLGKSVNSIKIEKTFKESIHVKNFNLYQKTSPKDRYIPAYYRLELIDKKIKTKEILVALNNKLVSHCFTFLHKPTDCAGLIDPEIYREETEIAAPTLRFFSVTSKDTGYVVDELLLNNVKKAFIQKQEDKDVIAFSLNKITPINIQAPIFGTASLRMTNNGATYEIDGWAGNTLTGEKAEEIYLFLDDKLFASVKTGVKKKYLYKQYGLNSLIDSGYHIIIPKEKINLENHKLRVFAKIKGLFTELNYHKDKNFPLLFQSFNPSTNRKIIKNSSLLLIAENKNREASTDKRNRFEFDAFDENIENRIIGDWFAISKHSRWIGSSASLVIPSHIGTNKIVFEFTAKPFIVKDILTEQSLELYINNVKVKTLVLSKKESFSFSETVKTNENEPILIELVMPNSLSPSKVFNSKDVRKLSLLLTEFKVINLPH